MTTKSSDARNASKTSLFLRTGVSLAALTAVAAFAVPAMAQTTNQDATAAAAPADDNTVVIITGFRGSLQTAINAKKKDDTMVDVIKSEDIAQFPDLNLAESLQRIPGVAIDRDGGEGRTITVRGLNSDFTRVRLNGLEAQATTGGKDSSGGSNRGRGFDFNVFAAELFNQITVRKSTAAEIEEGSLGATVDLQTARPFDYKGFAMAAQLEHSYNDLSKDGGPRGSFLVSNRWADGKLGALFSVAYGHRTVEEEGPNTTRWENAFSPSTVGHFLSWSNDGGATFVTDCTAATASGACGPTAGGSSANLATSLALNNALHPRIPRYSRFVTDEKRLGMTTSFQMKPAEGTLITLDGMYADYSANRDEYDFEAIGFSRNGQGLPASSIYNYTIDDTGTITKASFNNVDIRAEHRFDNLDTTFTQLNLTWDQQIGDKLSMKALIGTSRSLQDTPEQTTFTIESYNVQGYSYDFTDSSAPVFNYGTSTTGCTPDQACYWSYTPNTSATTPASSAALGDASLIRIRPQSVDNRFGTAKVDFKYQLNDNLTFKAGVSSKKYSFTGTEFGRYTETCTTGGVCTPAPITRDEAASTLTSPGLVTELGGNIAKYTQTVSLAGNTFLVPNIDLIRSTFNYDCNCTNAYGIFTVDSTNSSSRANNRSAIERDNTSYLQADFKTSLGGMDVRGNIGVRAVTTDEDVTGYVGKGSTSIQTRITRSYTDTLPSLNIAVEPMNNLYVRFAAAKTMARPTLQTLTPGGSITTSTQTIGSASAPLGNPYLNPVRSNNLDLSVEWYPSKESLFSVAVFQKDIKSYIQTVATVEPFSATGYDTSILSGTGQDGTTSYTVFTSVNTPGGMLKGWEANAQMPFTFLPTDFLKHFGTVLNYTNVESQINYAVSTSATSTTYHKYNLVGLSPESWNATLYYSDDKLEARIAASHRSGYISLILPGSGADNQSKHATTNIDSQITYKLGQHFTAVFEGINLTDQYDQRYDVYNTPQGNTNGDAQLDYSHPGRTYYLGLRYKY